MLAAGADRLLRGRRARPRRGFRAGKVVLEGHHARIDEQQGWIVLRHQGRGGHDGVIALPEIVQEVGADVVQARHRPMQLFFNMGGRSSVAVRGTPARLRDFPAKEKDARRPQGRGGLKPNGRNRETEKGRPGLPGVPRLLGVRRRGGVRRVDGGDDRPDRGVRREDYSSSGSGPPTSSSSSMTALAPRTACSMSLAMSGLALRNSRTLSRPWPMRWLA